MTRREGPAHRDRHPVPGRRHRAPVPAAVVADWRDAGRTSRRSPRSWSRGSRTQLPEHRLLLEEHAEGWTVARMTALDRTILRVGGLRAALRRRHAAVGGDQRGGRDRRRSCPPKTRRRFVNGILGRIARGAGAARHGGWGRAGGSCGGRRGTAGWRGGSRRRGAGGGLRPVDSAARPGAFLEALLELALRLADVARDLGELRRAEDHRDRDEPDDDPSRSHVRKHLPIGLRSDRTTPQSTPRTSRTEPSTRCRARGRRYPAPGASPFKAGPVRPGRERRWAHNLPASSPPEEAFSYERPRC